MVYLATMRYVLPYRYLWADKSIISAQNRFDVSIIASVSLINF